MGLAVPRTSRGRAAAIAVGGAGLALVAAVVQLVCAAWDLEVVGATLLPPVPTGAGTIELAVRADRLSALVAVMVAVVALCVQVYSTAYQADDPRYRAYAATVSLFTAAMLLVVQADDLLLLLVGWEAMGLCSYLLVGHDSEREAARAAAVKAFLVTRVGDVGFSSSSGIVLLWVASGTTDASATLLRPEVAGGGAGAPALTAAARPAAGGRRRRQVRAVPAAHLAPRRDGGPDARLGPDPRRDHGGRGGRGPGPPAAPPAAARPPRGPRGLDASPCSARPWSPACRPTSSACSRGRRSARWPTCSPPWPSRRPELGAAAVDPAPALARGVQGAAVPRRPAASPPGALHRAGRPGAVPAAAAAPAAGLSRSGCLSLAGLPPLSGYWSKEAVLGAAEDGASTPATAGPPPSSSPSACSPAWSPPPTAAAPGGSSCARRRARPMPTCAPAEDVEHGADEAAATGAVAITPVPVAMTAPLVVLAVPTLLGGLLLLGPAAPGRVHLGVGTAVLGAVLAVVGAGGALLLAARRGDPALAPAGATQRCSRPVSGSTPRSTRSSSGRCARSRGWSRRATATSSTPTCAAPVATRPVGSGRAAPPPRAALATTGLTWVARRGRRGLGAGGGGARVIGPARCCCRLPLGGALALVAGAPALAAQLATASASSSALTLAVAMLALAVGPGAAPARRCSSTPPGSPRSASAGTSSSTASAVPLRAAHRASLGVVVTVHVASAPTRRTTRRRRFARLPAARRGRGARHLPARDLILFFIAFEIGARPDVGDHPPAAATRTTSRGRRDAAARFVLYTALGSAVMLLGILRSWRSRRHQRPRPARRRPRRRDEPHRPGRGRRAAGRRPGGQGAGLAAAHLAAPSAHQRPDRGIGTAGGRPAQDGHLRPGADRRARGARGVRGGRALSRGRGVVGIVWGGLVCLVERDLKRLVAYSSVAHMGFVALGVSTGTAQGLQAALFANVAHGVITSLLFLLVGGLKDRAGAGCSTGSAAGCATPGRGWGARSLSGAWPPPRAAGAGRLLGRGARGLRRLAGPPGSPAAPAGRRSRWSRSPAPPWPRPTCCGSCGRSGRRPGPCPAPAVASDDPAAKHRSLASSAGLVAVPLVALTLLLAPVPCCCSMTEPRRRHRARERLGVMPPLRRPARARARAAARRGLRRPPRGRRPAAASPRRAGGRSRPLARVARRWRRGSPCAARLARPGHAAAHPLPARARAGACLWTAGPRTSRSRPASSSRRRPPPPPDPTPAAAPAPPHVSARAAARRHGGCRRPRRRARPGHLAVALELGPADRRAGGASPRPAPRRRGRLNLLLTSLLSFGLLALGIALWLAATGSLPSGRAAADRSADLRVAPGWCSPRLVAGRRLQALPGAVPPLDARDVRRRPACRSPRFLPRCRRPRAGRPCRPRRWRSVAPEAASRGRGRPAAAAHDCSARRRAAPGRPRCGCSRGRPSRRPAGSCCRSPRASPTGAGPAGVRPRLRCWPTVGRLRRRRPHPPAPGSLAATRGLCARDPLAGPGARPRAARPGRAAAGGHGLVAKVRRGRRAGVEAGLAGRAVAVVDVVLGIAVYLRWVRCARRPPRRAAGRRRTAVAAAAAAGRRGGSRCRLPRGVLVLGTRRARSDQRACRTGCSAGSG